MKKFTIYTLAPALALMALGCSSPTAMQSTEYDDMYYSSSDKTDYVEPQVVASNQSYQNYDKSDEAVAEGEVQNPEYSNRSNAVTEDYYGDEYYDGRTYDPRDNWYRPNYSYIDPYWGSTYTPRHYAYSRYNSAFYDPFYDPFYYDPFYYDPFYRSSWRSGISVVISYNYGWGGWNRPYPYYSRWYPNNPYYHGYYSGYYNNVYAGHNWYYDRPLIVNPVKTQYGPRNARGTVVTDGAGRDSGRPIRGESFEGDVVRTESTGGSTGSARPARPSRSGNTTVSPETGTDTKNALPARPGRTEYYVPRESRERSTQQPARVGEQQEQRRVIQPVPRERRSTRTREYTPPRTNERRSEQRQQQRPVQTRPAREQRREYTPPPTRSNDRRESSSSSSSSSSGSSESRSGGRPSRGH